MPLRLLSDTTECTTFFHEYHSFYKSGLFYYSRDDPGKVVNRTELRWSNAWFAAFGMSFFSFEFEAQAGWFIHIRFGDWFAFQFKRPRSLGKLVSALQGNLASYLQERRSSTRQDQSEVAMSGEKIKEALQEVGAGAQEGEDAQEGGLLAFSSDLQVQLLELMLVRGG